jgi:hypothetical protein
MQHCAILIGRRSNKGVPFTPRKVTVATIIRIPKQTKPVPKPKRKPGTRAGLTKAGIAAAAVKLIDNVGMHDFSVRNLAKAMGALLGCSSADRGIEVGQWRQARDDRNARRAGDRPAEMAGPWGAGTLARMSFKMIFRARDKAVNYDDNAQVVEKTSSVCPSTAMILMMHYCTDALIGAFRRRVRAA